MEDELFELESKIELSFLESVAKRLPDDIDIMKAVAELYTAVGRYDEGLSTDLKIIQACGNDSLSWYNLACSYALLGRKDEAFDALSRAIELGYDDYDWMKTDDDLAPLHGDHRFESLLNWLYSLSIDDDDF